ncbi:MAG: hypothetical protein LQ351_005238 [Letrouitia transgressa]|nr:MAG: hypothetical protein LQ351_005238 [Letrouitia transgressa]
MATMYGEGATYDAVEGRFRQIRRQAAQMIEEVNSGARPAAPTRGSGNNLSANNSFATGGDDVVDTPTTPKKPKGTKTPGSTPRSGKKNTTGEKILTGRVNKNQANVSAHVKANGKGGVLNGVNRVKEEIVVDTEDVGGISESMEFDAEGVAESLGLVGSFGEYDKSIPAPQLDSKNNPVPLLPLQELVIAHTLTRPISLLSGTQANILLGHTSHDCADKTVHIRQEDKIDEELNNK